MSGHCPKCGTYHEEDDDRLCSGCLVATHKPEGWREAVPDQEFCDGDLIICAVELTKGTFQYEVVSVRFDEGRFDLRDSYGDVWGWEWPDVSWWMPVPDLPNRKAALDAAGGS